MVRVVVLVLLPLPPLRRPLILLLVTPLYTHHLHIPPPSPVPSFLFSSLLLSSPLFSSLLLSSPLFSSLLLSSPLFSSLLPSPPFSSLLLPSPPFSSLLLH